MFVDFGARPPEVNATLVYGGDRSATMWAAAAAWDGLAVDLQSASASCKAVIAKLASEDWLGPSSVAMAAKLTPYTAWMDTTAVRAEQSALQAKAAAGAFDAAFAMTVPPPVIFANRAQLQALVATNFLGVNTPAIMATEALYLEMWAQCAAAMYSYAGTAAPATVVPGFDPPRQSAQARTGTENASPTQSGPGVQDILQGLLGSDTVAAGLGPNANLWNTVTSMGVVNPALYTSLIADLLVASSLSTGGLTGGSFGAGGPGIGSVMGATHLVGAVGPGPMTAGPVGSSARAGAAPVTAALGRATPIGTLSAPPSWTAAKPAATTAGVLPQPDSAAGPAGRPGAPGVPLAGAGRGSTASGPRYGIRPTVMARPPAAGYAPEAF